MSLFFANPAALWWMPAVGLPILYHLFFRRKNPQHDFPSLIFFQRIEPNLSAKRKLHEIVILALRMFIIALVILAIARPSTGLVLGSHGIARVIIIDNSGSMGGLTSHNLSKLQLACNSAEKLLEAQKPYDSSAIVLTVPDPDSSLPSGFDADQEALRDGIQKLQPTESAPNIARALRLALSLLKSAKQSSYEIHIITDLQANNWEAIPLGLQSTTARIVVHRIDTPPPHLGAISLELGDIPNRSFPIGRIIPLNLRLINQSKEKGDVQLNVTDESGKSRTQDVTLNGSEKKDVPFTFSFTTPGFHWAHIGLEGDVAPAGTQATVGFWITEVAKAVFVGGQHDFGALPLAVAPGDRSDLSGIEPDFIESDKLNDFLALPTPPLAVVLLWGKLPASPELKEYVDGGGTVFIVPPLQITSHSPVFTAPNWIDAAIEDSPDLPKDGESIIPLQPDHPLWRDLRDNSGQPQLSLIQAFRERPLQLDKSWTQLLVDADGTTLLGTRSIGKGHLFASGLALAPSWTTFPTKASFLVMIQNAFFGRTQEFLPLTQMLAGGDFPFNAGNASIKIRSLFGTPMDWQGQPGDFAGLPRTGVYECLQGGKTNWIAVRSNPDEALDNYLSKGNIPLLKAWAPDVLDLRTPEDMLVDLRAHVSGTSLYGDFMVLAFFISFLETWIANSSITAKPQKRAPAASRLPFKTRILKPFRANV